MPLSLYGDARNDAALIDSAAMSESSIAAAKIAAAKCAAINAKLAARGKTIETKLLVKLPTTVAGPTDPYSAEIMINDLQNRGLILKSQVQVSRKCFLKTITSCLCFSQESIMSHYC